MIAPFRDQVPATVTAAAHTFETNIDVEAIFLNAEPDVGLSAGYEICRATLAVDANLRGRVVNGLRVVVEGGEPVDIDVDPEALAKYDSIDLDDQDLAAELAAFLNTQSS